MREALATPIECGDLLWLFRSAALERVSKFFTLNLRGFPRILILFDTVSSFTRVGNLYTRGYGFDR